MNTNAYTNVEIDPSTPGTVVRLALAIESVYNISLAIPMLFNAKKACEDMFLNATTSATPSAGFNFQHFGIGLAAMTYPMIRAIPNMPGAIELRRTTYEMLTMFEIVALPLYWYVSSLGETATGIPSNKLLKMAVGMGIALGFRILVLYVRPEWLGRYRAKRAD